MMKKIVSFYSILFFFTLGVTHAWALPPCSSNTNAIWDNCVGTYEWTSGEFKGDKYVGEWKKDLQHGQGTYYFLAENEFKGDKYQGAWKDGKRHGQGTYIYADGSKYAGEWENNKRHGYAIQYNADGSIFREGVFKDDEFLYAETRENKDPSSQMSSLSPCPSDQNATYDMCFGTYDWTSGDNKGDKYIGEWKKDKMHGQGMYIFANGDRYQGAWKDGKKHGPGIYLYLADNEFKGDTYVGEYMDDIKNGQGTYIWKDGSKYTGNWLDNNQDGQGIYIYPDGSKEVGEFKNGLLNGFAIRYNADGSITQEGIFKDDEFLHAKTSEKKEPSKLDKYKSTCEELGFTPGTEKFGDCVIKLMD